MPLFSPVLWSEGMFLRPQHFQQQSHYLESALDVRCRTSRSYLWGFLDLQLDRSLLSVGKLGLIGARGVFPDGTAFEFPQTDALPSHFESEPDQREQIANQLVYLAVPLHKRGVPVVAKESAEDLARYRMRQVELIDETSDSADLESVTLGQLNVTLLLEGQDLSDYAYLPIARIQEVKGNGTVSLDENFAPPCLDVRASPVLTQCLQSLKGLIEYHADALATQVVQLGRGGLGEQLDFNKLAILNRYEPIFSHIIALEFLHPEEAFRTMLALLGDLVTFTSSERRGRDYPKYRHDQPELSFHELLEKIRGALSAAVERKALQLELVNRGYGIRTIAIPEAKLAKTGRFVVAAKGMVAAEKLGQEFPRLIRVASKKEISHLVNHHLPGIKTALIPHRPEEIPYHDGFVYFGLDPYDEMWQDIEKASEFALWVGGEIRGLELEAWVIREGV